MDTQPHYRPARIIGAILCLLLVGDLLLCVVGAGSGWMEIGLLNAAASGAEVTESEAMANDLRQGLIGLAQLGVYVVTVVFFCMWIFRANQNARALGAANMSFSPGWSVGWFFIPFMNLFKPFAAMKEIWKASDPYSDPVTWDQSKTSPIVGAWWAMWLICGFAGQAAFRTALSAQDIDSILVGSWLQFAADSLGVPLAVCALMMINGLQGRQTLKYMKQMQQGTMGGDSAGVTTNIEERPPWMFTNAA